MRAPSLVPIYSEAPISYPLQRRRLARWSKRAFDVAVAGIGLLILLPLILVVMLWLRLSSPGPIFYTAQRVGRRGKSFRLFKFRTMYVDADRIGPGVTRENDPRITPVGRLL
ncbi:MAG: sugar transferase, partial [Caldilineae bacterium]